MEIKVGNVVQLKSGGPLMTVAELGDYSPMGVKGTNQAKCIWFEKNKRFVDIFELETLEVVNE